MTAVVLLGFFLMLFAPCAFALYGGRDKRAKTIASSYQDRAVTQAMDATVEEEWDLPVRARAEEEKKYLVQTAPPVRVSSQKRAPAAVDAFQQKQRMQYREPKVHRLIGDGRGSSNLNDAVEQAESEALVAHAMAAQANAAAMAATARAAQARAQVAAEQAVAAGKAAANHAAAVRVAQTYAAASEAALAVAAKDDSRRAA